MKDAISLNQEQIKAVKHGEGPLLIIAGAGTGKTTVVTQRIKHLILDKGIDPSSILALTFTEKAALEMESRVDISLPYGYTSLWISTFHSFCDRILRDEAIHIGLNPSYKLTSEAESMLFLKKNLFKLNLDYFRPLGNPYKFLQGLIQHFNRLQDDDITPLQYMKFVENIQSSIDYQEIDAKKTMELANAFQIYTDLKSKESIMDFADLNTNVLKLFRMRPNILKYYQDKFSYIMVDEFQDTNFAQNELAMLLAGKKKNINVVGDDDQSIYRWRGAAIANIIYFRKRYPNAAIVTLNQNYRSSKEILDSSYQLIQFNNPDRLEIKEGISKKLLAVRGENKTPVQLIYANKVENEAEEVKEEIKKLVKEKNLQYKDIAILVRANDHSQPFVRALERARIPYQFLGPGHLFHQEEIKDLISYMKVLVNFEDNASMYRVLTLPIFDLDTRDIAALLNHTKKQNITLFEACEGVDPLYMNDQTKYTVKRITEMIKKHLKQIPRETAGQVLYYFLEDSGLLQQYLGAQLPHEEKKAQNIAKFFERLKEFEASSEDASIFAVVDWIELAMQLGESPKAADMDWSENNAVNILTVHSSKGLEFPAVFLVSLVTQRFPTRSRKEQIPIPMELIKEALPTGDYNLQEERRLFYVAATRAKDYLYLTTSQYYGEGRRERKISPFVYETLGEEAVNKIIKKEKATQMVQQLSLLDLANDQAQKSASEDLPVNQLTSSPANTPLAINYISYSQMQCFDICPLHYKLKNILKIPSVPSAAQSFGITIHSVLREYFAKKMRGEDTDRISIEELLKNNWVNAGYDSKEHMNEAFSHAKESLIAFVNAHGETKTTHLGLEIPFGFFIPNKNGGALKVGGRIDRIDSLDENNIEIIDYKTGYQIPDEKKLESDFQLSVYALAAAEVHDRIFNRKPENVTLSLWYIEQDVKVSTTRTGEQLGIIKQQILDKVELISTSDFRCNGSMICKNCEYKILCQTHSS